MRHRPAQSQVLFPAILLCGALSAQAQDTFTKHWQDVHDRQPTAVGFQISASKTQFYLGELIPLQLSFSSAQADAYRADTRLQDRVGRLNGEDQFLVDPAGLTEDPLRGLPGEDGGMGGLSGGPLVLSETPFSFEKLLNDWVRFREPGTYRIAILTHRVSSTGGSWLEMVSNILTLTVLPAPAAWVKEQTGEAVEVLDVPLPLYPTDDIRNQRLKAGRTLRFLDTPESSAQLVRHLSPDQGVDSWALHMGVLGSRHRQQLLPLMEAQLVAPGQPVWERYIDTLARLNELAASGPMAPYPSDIAQQKTWMAENQRRADLQTQKRKQYTAQLAAALPAKYSEARAVSMDTLLDSARRYGTTESPGLPKVVALVIADFRTLPPQMQSNLLISRWGMISTPAMLPVLREIYAHPPEPRVNPPLEDTAASRIYNLAPEEGRRIILSQIARPDTSLSYTTLSMLPDRTLPELNDTLISQLEEGRNPDMLILRYTPGDVVTGVEKAYLAREANQNNRGLPNCGGPLVFFFLQHDPPFGEKEMRSRAEHCDDVGLRLSGLDRNAYSPALERLAIEFLNSPKVPLKQSAAELLGQYGSPAAEKPLWDAMEFFHSWWKGRETELEGRGGGQENGQLERALRIALAQADGWTLQQEGLNRLLTLCSSGWCKQEVNQWIAQAALPTRIQIMPSGDGFRPSIAQYETQSDDQLNRKIRQFPAATAFKVIPLTSDDRGRAEAEKVSRMVRSAGYTLTQQ